MFWPEIYNNYPRPTPRWTPGALMADTQACVFFLGCWHVARAVINQLNYNMAPPSFVFLLAPGVGVPPRERANAPT